LLPDACKKRAKLRDFAISCGAIKLVAVETRIELVAQWK
jgi:hypothetical protein